MKEAAWDLIMANYVEGVGLRAGFEDTIHPEIWARDALISGYFLLNSSLVKDLAKKRKIEEIVATTIKTFLNFENGGRVPLRIEDSRFRHTQAIISNIWYNILALRRFRLIKRLPKEWNFNKAVFKSSQLFADYAIDPGLWLIVVADELDKRFPERKYWKKWSSRLKKFLEGYYKRAEVKNGLLIEGQLASWMDSYRFPGGIAMSYTNLIFLKSLEIFRVENGKWEKRYLTSKKIIFEKLVQNGLFCLGRYRGKLIEAVTADANLMACWWFGNRRQTQQVIEKFSMDGMFEVPVRAIVKDSWKLRLHGLANIPNTYHLTNSWPWLTGWGILAARKYKLREYEKIVSGNLTKVCELNKGFPETVNREGKLVTWGPLKLSNRLTWTAAAVLLIK